MRQRLTSAAHYAIKIRSQEADVVGAVKKLERDLRNGHLASTLIVVLNFARQHV